MKRRYVIRLTLKDGRRAEGLEAQRLDAIFGTDEGLTMSDVARAERRTILGWIEQHPPRTERKTT